MDKHVAKLFLMDFEQSGISLNDEARETVVKLNDRILQLGQQFAAGTQRPAAAKKNMLPQNIRHLFHVDGENVVLNGKQLGNS